MSTTDLKGKKIVVIENGLISTYTMREGLMMRLLQEGCQVYVLTHANSYVSQVEKTGLKVIDVGSGNVNPINVTRYIYALHKSIKKINPDVCLTFSIRPAIWGNIITRRLKIPTITNITGVGPLFQSKSFAYRTARVLYKHALARTQKVFFQNYDDMNLFIQNKFVKNPIAERIPGSGVDYNKFSPLAAKNRENGSFTFLFIGRLIKDKGIFEYINAARQTRKINPHATFNVIGPFWTQNLKKNTITQKELHNWMEEGVIDYLGEKKDVRKYIAEADCVVLPSYREGTSNTLLEAGSMEKPAITTNTTGCREIVEDNVTGLLCNVKDENDLAEKMQKMMSLSDEDRKEMGHKARQKIIREYDKQIVIAAYLKAIREILNSRD